MITSWVISFLIILVVRILVGKTTLVQIGPTFVESIVGGLRDIVEQLLTQIIFHPLVYLVDYLFLS